VLLSRLRIRSRLALLILVPLVAALGPTVVAAVDIGQTAARAADTASRVRAATQVAILVRCLQRERLVAVGLLLKKAERRDLVLAEADTQDAADAVGKLGLSTVDTQLPTLAHLDDLRKAVVAGLIRPVDVISAYSLVAIQMLDSVKLLDVVDGDTAQGQGAIALDSVLRANEGFAMAMVSMAAGGTPDIASAYVTALDLLMHAAQRFVLYATPAQQALYGIGQEAVNARLGKDFNASMVGGPGATIKVLSSPPSYPDVVSLTGVGQYFESRVINETLANADGAVRQGETRVTIFLGLSVLLVLIAVALGMAVARSVTVPVRRLTRSAESVVELAESELVRVADDESGEAEQVRLRPIEVSGQDELATFARAFGRVQETAARLVERQVASRRNVALMFGHVGRRTQNLVGRQISLIDRLESRETEPERLSDLYRLDHISSRLRRSASSLVVLSGSGETDEHVSPMPLDALVRLGLAEIEDYTRVDVRVGGEVNVVPALINDLVLLLAELMENATGFSPPGTRVVVSSVRDIDGVWISVIDHGIGMTVDRIVEENSRLTRRERLDLAPTEVLGLFVVGRLARRHGLTVALNQTPGGGVTATAHLPARLLADTVAPGAQPVRRNGNRPAAAVQTAMAHSPRELDLLSRASVVVREVRPWNAFAAGSRAGSPQVVASAQGVVPTRGAVPASGRWAIPTPPGPTVVARPTGGGSVSWQRSEPGPSTLSRRVPGASLNALEAEPAARGVPLAQTSSPHDVRDRLADFESGVARAMREVQQGEQR
jgi:signal transduction histidine kinase